MTRLSENIKNGAQRMSDGGEHLQQPKETFNEGFLVENGVRVKSGPSADELSARGYGVKDNDGVLLKFYEALYLLDKGLLKVRNEEGNEVTFDHLLHFAEKTDENIWTKYIVYRDLRSRGYVVRGGFGLSVDFRVYERGEYGKDTAKYLILTLQEGKNITLAKLAHVLKQCQNLKKELVLAVMSRRGEIVYYSVSQLNIR
ncbi:MAG: tRNA-intron lyase [Candidatus Bathyarchaeota archaeon]|nr:tRNA-intron lyase [Candidatus Bathyarchaeota archaeon]MCX8178020.1 tRNA-intron lyase [Candidatus Bathyarchaeota archaeon]MDW8194527.1 tRNA-intron lyase [Nitrososphaerota archaeon]